MKTWTTAEEQFLRDNYQQLSHKEMAAALGKTDKAIGSKLKAMKLKLPLEEKRRRQLEACMLSMKERMLTAEQDDFVRDNYLTMLPRELAAHLGRAITAIKGSMKRQRLIVPTDILEMRIQMGRKQKGGAAHNKGQKMKPEVYERVKHTFFKSSHKPHNTQWDGAESFRYHRSGAYWYVRVAEGKWVLKHRLVWEAVYGPVPAKHNVIFRDGDVNNIAIENLELVSNKDLMRRNSGSINLTDAYVASCLAGRGEMKHLKNEFAQLPELIELKRNSLKLKKVLKNADAN